MPVSAGRAFGGNMPAMRTAWRTVAQPSSDCMPDNRASRSISRLTLEGLQASPWSIALTQGHSANPRLLFSRFTIPKRLHHWPTSTLPSLTNISVALVA